MENTSENNSENKLAESLGDNFELSLAKRVGFGTRLGASVIDQIFIVILSVVLGSTIGAMFGSITDSVINGNETKSDVIPVGLIAGVLVGLLGILLAFPFFSVFFSLMEASTGRTPAKLVFGLVVANENGTKGNIKTLGLRALVKATPNILFVLSSLLKISVLQSIGLSVSSLLFIGCFFVLDAKRQSFHDLIGKTAVFRAREIKLLQVLKKEK